MRANIAEDPNFARKCRAWLNEIEVTKDCFETDEEQGYVLIHKRNEDGHHFLNPDGETIASERKEGIVRIEGPVKEDNPCPDS